MDVILAKRVALALIFSLLTMAAFAQTLSISGRVTDPDRRVVMGADVTLITIASGRQTMARTSSRPNSITEYASGACSLSPSQSVFNWVEGARTFGTCG